MKTRRRFLAAAAAVIATSAFAGGARAVETIKIGEINSYTRFPAFTQPYKNGWKLAVDEINSAGGVLGRQIEVISRDDAGKPGDAVKIAEELISRDKVVMLAGTFLSNIGLAVTEFAGQNKVMFVAAEPLSDAVTWANGNHYTFRLRPNTTMQAAMLAEEAAKLGLKRWATIAPNYNYGQDFVAAFKKALQKLQPDAEFVGEQWPALGKIDAGAETQALASAKPDAIFNVTFGADLAKFVREGNLRGLFEGRAVVSALSGEPEYLDPLKDEAPDGWIVTGYPWYAIDTPEHRRFVNAYRARFADYPRLGSVVGYNTFKAIATIIGKAASTDTEKMIAAAEGITVDSRTGPFTFRAIDHQATMGAYVGRTALKDGQGIMVNWRYADGADYMPTDAEVKKMRGN
jgi:branched-chain amino acid transport system substrate-binding protein